MIKKEKIALFDMDGTLCDFDKAIYESLEKLKSPKERSYKSLHDGRIPNYITKRAELIKCNESWWEYMPRFKLGWDILELLKKDGFRIMILTQGPRNNPVAWSGKMRWLNKNLPGEDITITRDKGLVYGKILVDDYPEYIKKWLVHRPRGLVIMPANNGNKNFKHSQVIRYTGKNLNEIKKALAKLK